MTVIEQGLVFARRLDGRGGAEPLVADDLAALGDPSRPIWVHLDRDKPDTKSWLEETARVPPAVCVSLLTEDTRPRAEAIRNGLLINLRGVNLNPGADPEDMLSLRIWFVPGLVVTLRRHRIMAAQDMAQSLDDGRGPKSLGGLIAGLAENLTERMLPTIENLDEKVDSSEAGSGEDTTDMESLIEIRRTAVVLRRFVSPQQSALSRLATLPIELLGEDDRIQIRHSHDTVTRIIEDLDLLRERCGPSLFSFCSFTSMNA